jgi:hypothetical protein
LKRPKKAGYRNFLHFRRKRESAAPRLRTDWRTCKGALPPAP